MARSDLKPKVIDAAKQRLSLLGCADAIPASFDFTVLADEVEQSIKNYCNINTVPEALVYVWANMIVDLFRWIRAVKNTNDADGAEMDTPTFMSSLGEGDVTVSFSQVSSGGSAGSAHDMDGVLDQVVMNYCDALNKFRRVVW